MRKRSANLLLLPAHLLLMGLLLGSLLCLLQKRTLPQYYLAEAGGALSLVLLAGVGLLLIRRLWQQRWMGVGAFALLLLLDGLALGSAGLLMFFIGAVLGPGEAASNPIRIPVP